jgi:hypothetical protein
MIGTTASLEATSTETRVRTHNLIGRIPGRDPDAGAVLLVAHWDHFGVCAGRRDLPGCGGQCQRVAVITEVARQIVAPGRSASSIAMSMSWPPRRRNWACWARWPLPNPPLPLGRIVAAFNVDSTGAGAGGWPVAIVGAG